MRQAIIIEGSTMRNILLVLAILINSFPAVQAVPIGKNVEYIGPGRTIGVDIINPNTAAKLDVNGQVLIRGGFTVAPAAGLVLTTLDANGLAAWATPAVTGTIANSDNAATANFADTAGSSNTSLNATNLTGAGTITNTTIDGFVDFSVNADLQGHTVNGDLVADSFNGDGSALTNITASAINGSLTNITNIDNTNITNSLFDNGSIINTDLNDATLNGRTTVDGTLVFEPSTVFNGDNLSFINTQFSGLVVTGLLSTENINSSNIVDTNVLIAQNGFGIKNLNAAELNGDIANVTNIINTTVTNSTINNSNLINGSITNTTINNSFLNGTTTVNGTVVFETGSVINGENLTTINFVANRAIDADNASTANFATSAASATNANFATNADNASTANLAELALLAINANNATIADFATNSGNATTANLADTALTLVSPDLNTTIAITTNSGNLGIGTTNPEAKLHVNGDIIAEGNVFTPGNPWILVHSEKFETTPTGWSNNTTTTCGSHRILGGFGVAGAGVSLTKTFDVSAIPHTDIKVKFNYYSLDSWDSEYGFARIAGQTLWSDIAHYSYPTRQHLCGHGSYKDQTVSEEMFIEHTANSVIVSFGSTLNSGPTNESFGIDNVEIWVKAVTNTIVVTPPVTPPGFNASCASDGTDDGVLTTSPAFINDPGDGGSLGQGPYTLDWNPCISQKHRDASHSSTHTYIFDPDPAITTPVTLRIQRNRQGYKPGSGVTVYFATREAGNVLSESKIKWSGDKLVTLVPGSLMPGSRLDYLITCNYSKTSDEYTCLWRTEPSTLL